MGVPKDVPDAAAGTPSPVSPTQQHTVNRDTGTPADEEVAKRTSPDLQD